MAYITHYPFVRHLRAEPNQYILHFKGGRLAAKGPGLAYWFSPLAAAVAQVPVEDCETTFMLNERSSDLQELAAQCTIRYRFAAPEKAASRINFSISLTTGRWIEAPLERLAAFWSQRAQHPARSYLTRVPIVEAIRSGAEVVRSAIDKALLEDKEIQEMGLALVSVQVVRIAPTPELEKAMQTPTREELQQKADEAVFARRALAVEKERAIKENELATQVELAKRQEVLIGQQGANQLQTVANEAKAEAAKAQALAARMVVTAESYAKEVQIRAVGDAEAKRLTAQASTQAERERMEIYRDTPSEVLLALALREAAQKIQNIQHLNVTPDLIGDGLSRLLRKQAEK